MNIYHPENAVVPIKLWTDGVPIEESALKQLEHVARLPIVVSHIAVMPDVHWGRGATIGSVIPTQGTIIPAAVGVDIGCGMMAVRTTLTANDLPGDLHSMRLCIEEAVPHGRTHDGGKGDAGAWGNHPPSAILNEWDALHGGFKAILQQHPKLGHANTYTHLGTLGTGNHFIEVCIDEREQVWLMLHSGSRGVGNRIGSYFIELAKKDMARHGIDLPNKELAYLQEGSEHFSDYVIAVSWAQEFARINRTLMMQAVIKAIKKSKGLPHFSITDVTVNCHHNYVQKEIHFGQEVYLTRKGAVRAGEDDLGIIPGSMGARSFIVRGKGNPDSFYSCSHGAGRKMGRAEAKRQFTLQDHRNATEGVECRKDTEVIDETPGAYKDIEAVMNAQADLVEILYTLKQVICVKG
ncbi:RtcB family protein [Candidatus Uhrbacteria bacterium]|nr:RtcB family protein [Candidatus Uhrbacteria bacterium]